MQLHAGRATTRRLSHASDLKLSSTPPRESPVPRASRTGKMRTAETRSPQTAIPATQRIRRRSSLRFSTYSVTRLGFSSSASALSMAALVRRTSEGSAPASTSPSAAADEEEKEEGVEEARRSCLLRAARCRRTAQRMASALLTYCLRRRCVSSSALYSMEQLQTTTDSTAISPSTIVFMMVNHCSRLRSPISGRFSTSRIWNTLIASTIVKARPSRASMALGSTANVHMPSRTRTNCMIMKFHMW
mmetsp:Transcript_27067/g.86887  ORF Transcript_27067/g.86887 Transcript_27067/m.86887 type:complete len:246 (+) Transcript_27067:66-803(+)